MMGERGQSLPFLRLPKAPGGWRGGRWQPVGRRGDGSECVLLLRAVGLTQRQRRAEAVGEGEKSGGSFWSLWWHGLADLQWSVAALHGQQDESVSAAKGAWEEWCFGQGGRKGQGFWIVLVVATEGKGLFLTCSAVAQGHGLFVIIVLPLRVVRHSAC